MMVVVVVVVELLLLLFWLDRFNRIRSNCKYVKGSRRRKRLVMLKGGDDDGDGGVGRAGNDGGIEYRCNSW